MNTQADKPAFHRGVSYDARYIEMEACHLTYRGLPHFIAFANGYAYGFVRVRRRWELKWREGLGVEYERKE